MKELTIKNGLFIALEGGEGSGKSTLAKSLKEHYESLGYKVLLTREPGGTEIGEKIREYVLNNELDSYTELLLFSAARRYNVLCNIVPALDNGKIVICDRYVTSTMVYQALLGTCTTYIVNEITDAVVTPSDRGYSIYPDIEFLLDINAETGIKRIKNRNDNNKFDVRSIEYHKKINSAYLSAIDKSWSDKKYVINASNTKDEVKSNVIDLIDRYINDEKLIIESR